MILSTTFRPNSCTRHNSDGEQCFTITHPFHPLSGHIFPRLSQRFVWGGERVFFVDPQTQQTRSLPRAWTSLALPDPFLVVAGGRTVLRLSDAQLFGRSRHPIRRITTLAQQVAAHHLSRLACLYVRQSTLQQVFEHTESTARQYALRERARAPGWAEERIAVIHQDLGHSGAWAADRLGFQQLVAEVGLGHVRLVLGLEVSRLARNERRLASAAGNLCAYPHVDFG
jgi:hypothetical protein